VAPGRLLVISNGHGEDSIGAEIVRRLPSNIEASAYPTLGTGAAYAGVCDIVGPRAHLTSAGSRVATGTFVRDMRGGLLATIPPGIAFARRARRDYDAFLVVGDFVGVLGCFLTGIRNIVYVDVYKTGFGRPYGGLERWIIAKTCRTVFTRHATLATELTHADIDARTAGNVMMDTIARSGIDLAPLRSRSLAVTLLPGSRAETAANFALQLEALRRLPQNLMPDVFLALAPGLDPQPLAHAAGFSVAGDTLIGDVTVHVVQGALGDLVAASDVVLSQAGTATVQTVGLGKPVLSFTRPTDRMSRHRDESRLFGDSRILVRDDATELSSALATLLADPADRTRRGAIGRDRIGPQGAMAAIVAELAR
jgi:uncharacterized protein (TIGR03492 family)